MSTEENANVSTDDFSQAMADADASPSTPVTAPDEALAQISAQPSPPVGGDGELQVERDRREKAENELNLLRQHLSKYTQQREQFAQSEFSWEAPDAWTRNEINNAIAGVSNQFHEKLMYNARLTAESINGKEEVRQAEEAFNKAVISGKLDPHEVVRINSSPNPFMSAVEWNKRNNIVAEIGGNLEEYKKRLLEDKEFLAMALRKMQSAGAVAVSSVRGLPSANKIGTSATHNQMPTELFRDLMSKNG